LPVFEVFANNSIIAGQYGVNDFVISGNKVGIGLANPINKLSVSGAVSIGSSYNVAAPSNGLIVQGDVGIGVTSFNYSNANRANLEMYGATDSLIALRSSSGNSYIQKYINDLYINNVTNGALAFFNNGSERWRITSAGVLQSNADQTIQTSTGVLTLATAAGNGNIILSPHGTGNVGIGTASPLTKLDVRSGSITAGTNTSTAGTTIIAGYYTAGALTVLGTEQSSGGPVLGYAVTPSTSGTGAFLSATSIAIPRSAYTQDGGTHRWYIGASQTVAIGSAVTASEVMRINSSGNVGVGTTTVSYKLHVQGDIYARSAVINVNGDLNTLRGNVTTMGYSLTNSPSGTGWITVNTSQNFLSSGDILSQLAYDNYNQQKLFTRYSADYGATWSAWKTIINSDAVSGTTNYVPKFTGTNSIGNSLIFDNGTNVAVGSNAVAYGRLQISATGTSPSLSSTNPTDVSLIISNSDIAYGTMFATYGDGKGALQQRRTNTATYYDFSLQPHGGNVGIGTASAAAKLEVYGVVRITESASGSILQMQAGTSALDFASTFYGGAYRPFTFTNGGSERLRIQSDGNVGIGTTNPTNRLHVYSSNNELVFIRGTTAGAWVNIQSSTSNLWSIGADGVNGFSVYNRTSNGYALIVTNGGNLGIGNITTASNKLHVNGSTSIGSNYNTAAPTNGLIVEGNVGIGMTTTNYKLNVSTSSQQGFTLITNASTVGGPQIDIYDATRAEETVISSTDGTTVGSYIASYLNHPLLFGAYASVSPTAKMVVATSGNVGIGVINPLAQLHINETTSGAAALRVDGTNGTLFSVIDDLSDSLMSVNNSAGLPVLEVFADDRVVMGQYGANDLVVRNNKVGIGTVNPGTSLEIYATPATSTTLRQMLIINTDFASASGTGFGGSIVFRGRTAGNLLRDNAQISAYNEDAGDNGYALGFFTRPSDGGGLQQRMTIARGGNVGIGTNSPGALLNVNGRFMAGGATSDVATAHILMNTTGVAIQYTGNTGNYLMISPGAANTTISLKADARTGAYPPMDFWTSNTSRMTILANGNVGINNTNPVFRLDVNGTSAFRDTVNIGPNIGTITWGSFGGGSGFGMKAESGRPLSLGANGNFDHLVINTSGNVGIGTTNPSSSLHVSKAGNSAGGTILMGVANDNTAKFSYLVSTQYNSSSNAKGFSLIGGYTDASSNVVSIGGSIYEANPATELQFYTHTAVTHATGGTRRMTINTNGNVGIGYTNPAYLLDVNGVARINGNFNITGGGDLGIFDSDGTGTFYSYMDAGVGYIRIDDGSSANGKLDINNSLLYIQQAGGNVGVGTNNPTSKLHVWNGTVRVSGFQSIAAGPLTFLRSDYNGSAAVQINFLNINPSNGYDSDLGIQLMNTAGSMVDVMRVKGSTGNVGIGVINPLAQLHINEATSGAAALRVDGTNGTLFSVIDDLSDSLMSVNNSAGLPVLEVFADDRVVMGQYGANDFVLRNNKIGVGTNNPNDQLTFAQVDDDAIQIRRRTVSQGGPAAGTGISWTWTSATTDTETWAAIRAIFPGNSDSHLTFSTRNTSSVFGERMRIQNSGNVGINNTNPVFRLDVNGTSGFRDTIAIGPSIGTITWGSMGGGTGFGIRAESGRAFSLGANGNYDYIVINTSGNVGVGTTGPIARLHVYDTNQSPATGNLLVTSTGGNASIRIDSSSISQYTYFTLSQGGTGRFELGIVPTSSDFYINPTVQSGANGAAIYVKKADGNVGINSTSPNSPLTVYNNSDVWHFRLGGASGELRMGGQTNSGAVICL